MCLPPWPSVFVGGNVTQEDTPEAPPLQGLSRESLGRGIGHVARGRLLRFRRSLGEASRMATTETADDSLSERKPCDFLSTSGCCKPK